MAKIQILSRKSGKRYRVQFMKNGRRIGKVFDKKKEAELFLAQLTVDNSLAENLTNYTLNTLLFSDACKEYLEQYRGKDPSQSQRINFWAKEYQGIFVGKVNKSAVKNTLKSLKSKGLKPATLNRYKASISALFAFLVEEYDIEHNPAKEIKQLTENNARTRFLSENELNKLLGASRDSNWDRLYLLVLMAITTGARRSEMLGLKWNDIDFTTRTATLNTSKNGTARVLPLTMDVINELKIFRELGNGYIFPHPSKLTGGFRNFDKYWDAAKEQSNVQDFRFHDLRHSAASLLAKNGATLLEIADVLGHKSLEMTKRYAHLCIGHKSSLIDKVMGGISNG